MIELFLIRHGTTTLPEHFIGETDVPLSPVGKQELRALSEAIVKRFLSSERPLAAIYSSNLQRSIESARILADMAGLEPRIVPDLRELGFGAWEGLTYEQITEEYPEEFAAWRKSYNRKGPPGGESMATLRRRVINALDQILACHKDGERLAIVAHGGVNRVILCHFLGLPLNRIFSLGQQHGAMNVIELRDGRAVIRILNWQP